MTAVGLMEGGIVPARVGRQAARVIDQRRGHLREDLVLVGIDDLPRPYVVAPGAAAVEIRWKRAPVVR